MPLSPASLYRRVFKKIIVGGHERALLYKQRRLVQVLQPGVYKFFDLRNEMSVETFSVSDVELQHPHVKVLWNDSRALLEPHLMHVHTGEWEVMLVYVESTLTDIVPPQSDRYYWKGPLNIRLENVLIQHTPELPPGQVAIIASLVQRKLRSRIGEAVVSGEVPSNFTGLLKLNGIYTRVLKPGAFGFWGFNRSISVTLLDGRIQAFEVPGQEILTKDKVSLRLNVALSYRIDDPETMIAAIPDHKDFLYRETQFGIREAVGTRTLDELLSAKDELNRTIMEYVTARATVYGITILSVGLKDVILPGEMRTILNQVVEAEKVAQANIIKRREETAATRSLLNTAKLMEDNPLLLRLKELEVIERVTEKVEKLTVFGGLDGVLNEIVRTRPKEA